MSYKEPVHVRITENAFALALAHNDFLATLGASDDRDIALLACTNGAFHEDDFPNSLNHFYAPPPHSLPLTVPLLAICTAVGQTAPDWALTYSGNAFGLDDAHSWAYKVLAGTSRTERDVALYNTFDALGHVMHLVQDMAQPEHTRNDQHLTDEYAGEIGAFGDIKSSMYEE
ncbi:MAG: hypothetical protein ABI837_06005 [Acidobacteriota bacterium]